MENSKIRIGIIGAGRMGITHFSIINSHPNVEITAIADPSKLIVSLLKKYTGVTTYKGYKELLNGDLVDAVLVCTPPHLHFNILKLASEKGVHVFCEKPFTTDFKEGKELAEIFASKYLVNQVGYVNRYNDVFVKAKELISKGVIGNIVRFKSEMFSCTVSKPDNGEGWRSNSQTGGGALYEMGAHAIDLVNYLIGKPDKVIGSSLNKIFSNNVEDALSSTFLYNDGKSGTLYVNWSDTSFRKPSNKIEIFGDNGKLLADQHSLKIFLNKDNSEFKFKAGWNTLYITDLFRPVPFYVRGNEFTRQLYDFVDVIVGTKKINICSFEDGVDTLEIIDKINNDSILNAII